MSHQKAHSFVQGIVDFFFDKCRKGRVPILLWYSTSFKGLKDLLTVFKQVIMPIQIVLYFTMSNKLVSLLKYWSPFRMP